VPPAASGRPLGGARIRRAGPEDLARIVDLRMQFERITRDSGSLDEPARRAELGSLLGPDLAEGRLLAWIAEAGDRAVGQSGLLLRGAEAELINVYVEPGSRGCGLGTALVEAAIAEARARSAPAVTLQPTEDSRRIYERAGFRAAGRRMVLRLREGAEP
jgi:GNAT superfamily N-acetyltransferase